jgi:hypothetical protein
MRLYHDESPPPFPPLTLVHPVKMQELVNVLGPKFRPGVSLLAFCDLSADEQIALLSADIKPFPARDTGRGDPRRALASCLRFAGYRRGTLAWLFSCCIETIDYWRRF